MPNPVFFYRNWTPKFEWEVFRCGSTNSYMKDMCLKRDWNTCSEYDNPSRFNNEHNCGNLCDQIMSTRNFTLFNM